MTETEIEGAIAWNDSANPGHKILFTPEHGMLRHYPDGRWRESWLGPLIEQLDELEERLPNEETQELARKYVAHIGAN